MKPNEFVRKFGWEESKEALNHVAWCEGSYCTKIKHGCIKNNHDCCVDVSDLKRLVESHELVESYGSINQAKQAIIDGNNHCMFIDLEQAIADVESCQ